MSGREDWLRVGNNRRCPVCERPDWCLLSRDGAPAEIDTGKAGGHKRLRT